MYRCVARASPRLLLSDVGRIGEYRGDDDLFDVGAVRNQIQNGRDQLLEDSPEAPGAGLVLDRELRDLLEYLGLDNQLDAFVLEYLPELLVDRVLRLGQDPHQCLF